MECGIESFQHSTMLSIIPVQRGSERICELLQLKGMCHTSTQGQREGWRGDRYKGYTGGGQTGLRD